MYTRIWAQYTGCIGTRYDQSRSLYKVFQMCFGVQGWPIEVYVQGLPKVILVQGIWNVRLGPSRTIRVIGQILRDGDWNGDKL